MVNYRLVAFFGFLAMAGLIEATIVHPPIWKVVLVLGVVMVAAVVAAYFDQKDQAE